MILILLVFSIIILCCNSIEWFTPISLQSPTTYRQELINASHTSLCQPGYTLLNCKVTTPKISTRVLENISTVCECADGSNSYNILV